MSTEQVIVDLKFSPGIYQVKLYQGQQLIENIGLWYGIEPQNIPNEIHDNETLVNYCYTILGNESIENFFAALEQLNHQEKIYVPQWLNKDGLVRKIQKILETILSFSLPSKTKSESNIENMEPSTQAAAISGQWCLVTVRQWKRETFLKYLDNDIQRNHLQELILEIVAPEESIYQDMVLIRNSSFIEARSHLQQIDHFQSIQRLKPSEVGRMLNK